MRKHQILEEVAQVSPGACGQLIGTAIAGETTWGSGHVNTCEELGVLWGGSFLHLFKQHVKEFGLFSWEPILLLEEPKDHINFEGDN